MCVYDPIYGNFALYAPHIPVTVLREGDQVTLRLLDASLDPQYRLIQAEPAPRTLVRRVTMSVMPRAGQLTLMTPLNQ